MQSACRRFGIELQVMPIPKKRSTTPVSGEVDQTILDSSVNWLRVPMYQAIASSLRNDVGPDYFRSKVAIEVGGSEGTIARTLESLGAAVEVAPNYPAVDVEGLPYRDGSYDVIILDQVFEHLKHPWRAADEIKRVLRPNGLSICTSVFVYPLHKFGVYEDYYRFSPEGLRIIFENFKIVSSEGWGSAQVLRMAYGHSDRGPEGSDPISKHEAKRLGIYEFGDQMNYIMTWCIAKKTG